MVGLGSLGPCSSLLLFMASDCLRKLRSSIHKVVLSRRLPLASVGAVLSLTTGCDPANCVVWFRFRMLQRYLALYPLRLDVSIDIWTWSVKGAQVMVQCIFLFPVLLRLVFGGTLFRLGLVSTLTALTE